jgi:hypothetical protein
VICNPTSFLDVGILIVGSVQHQSGNMVGRQDTANVDLGIHPQQRNCRSRAGRTAKIGRYPPCKCRIIRFARRIVLHVHEISPFAQEQFRFLLPLFRSRCPGIIRTPNSLGESAKNSKSIGPVGMTCGKWALRLPPSENPISEALREPTASMTTRRSSARSSSSGNCSFGTRSDKPVPRLSNRINREKEAI